MLARRRVALGFVSGLLVLWLAQPTATTIAIGGVIALAGDLLRASGPYRWLPHPLYVGSSIMGAGLAVASASGVVVALVVVYLVSTLTAAVTSEVALLRSRFGDRYDAYRASRRGAGDTATQRFSLARAMANREYRAVAGLVAAVLLLLLKAAYNGTF
jgi:protein-S-isoprenylcysteine O-methyltransferase Ste14